MSIFEPKSWSFSLLFEKMYREDIAHTCNFQLGVFNQFNSGLVHKFPRPLARPAYVLPCPLAAWLTAGRRHGPASMTELYGDYNLVIKSLGKNGDEIFIREVPLVLYKVYLFTYMGNKRHC